jgi:uncharacterized protein (DUF4415 family)/predicted nucleic acid-binding protein
MNESRTNWDKLRDLKDPDIDRSDIAELDESFFKNAEIRIPKTKQMVSIRLDEEVLEWYKAQGKGYQTRINEILKKYMAARSKPHERHTDGIRKRTKVMLDTLTFKRVLDENIEMENSRKDLDIYISTVHYDQIFELTDELRKKAFDRILRHINQDPKSHIAWHASGSTDMMEKKIDEVGKQIENDLKIKAHYSKDYYPDVRIATMAISNGLTLLTDDKLLASIVQRYNGSAESASTILDAAM